MTFIKKIEKLMKENNISNRSELSKISGIPYTTIDGLYRKGINNIKLSTLKKLTDCLNCSLDYLVNDDISIENDESNKINTIAAHFEGDEFTPEELNKIKEYALFVKMQSKENKNKKKENFDN